MNEIMEEHNFGRILELGIKVKKDAFKELSLSFFLRNKLKNSLKEVGIFLISIKTKEEILFYSPGPEDKIYLYDSEFLSLECLSFWMRIYTEREDDKRLKLDVKQIFYFLLKG